MNVEIETEAAQFLILVIHKRNFRCSACNVDSVSCAQFLSPVSGVKACFGVELRSTQAWGCLMAMLYQNFYRKT
jgi:hypothetical protein